MPMNRIRALALLLALQPPGVVLAGEKIIPPQDTPIALLKEIYGDYPADAPASAWHKADKNWGLSSDVSKLPGFDNLPLTTAVAALKRRVDKTGDLCIDYDLISNSQDPDIVRYRIVAPAARSKARAQYDIYFQGKFSKGQTRITYSLVQDGGKWRVDDIVTYRREKGRILRDSARSLLQNCLKS